jgi:MFS transporter, MFS domain-containing protein family, molybdate-anion transporter
MFLVRLVGLLLATVQVGAFASRSPLQIATRPNPSVLRQPQPPHYFTNIHNPLGRRHHSATHLALSFPRGGAAAASLGTQLSQWNSSPSHLFNTSLVALALITAVFKIAQRSRDSSSGGGNPQESKPERIVSLQRRFLAVFWLLRCADWLQGPYFYEVYASKVFDGVQASMGLVSQLFLTGFASTALFGPLVGRATDNYGRKKGTLAFSIIYALGAISTKSPLLKVLFLGRILSGIGTSLLFSAPESWLVGEAQKSGDDPEGKYLGETFGLVSEH